jgi:hypothetical protein
MLGVEPTLPVVDNARLGDSRHLVSSTGEVARRRLSDGREFDIVKRFWRPRELEREGPLIAVDYLARS